MKKKRKSPKALRLEKRRIERLGLIAEDGDTYSFSFDYDGGIQTGDFIRVSGTSDSEIIDHRQVHPARRRQSKGKDKAVIYQVKDATATTLTVEDTNNGIYQVTKSA